jgi:ubiquinone/menaquinone biosynthesis C-methylase UbiE
MRNVFEKYAELPKFLRRPLWRFLHNFIAKKDKQFDIHFMNYGYYDESTSPLDLKPEDEPERYCINLYHQDVCDVDLQDRDILEVGCGRGGGASYISRYFKPKIYTGLDLSKKGIKYCNENYDIPGLSFVRGKAEELPFENESFDAVVNVESSRCYADMDGFLSEVHRVLRPGGHLLFSDMRSHEDNKILKEQFNNAELSIEKERYILPQVLAALERDNERRKDLIAEKAPKFLKNSLYEFSGVKGSRRYRLFEDGTMGYFSYVLKKMV